ADVSQEEASALPPQHSLQFVSQSEPVEPELIEGQKYRLGDMLWAKVGSHPYWPCMIYYGPHSGNTICRPHGKAKVAYHVQFFGPLVERAWVPDNVNLLPYEGKDGYDDYVAEQTRKGGKSAAAHFDVKARIAPAWEASWREAELAYAMDRAERMARFGRVYVDKPAKQVQRTPAPAAGKKRGRPRKSVSSSTDEAGKPSASGVCSPAASASTTAEVAEMSQFSSASPPKKRVKRTKITLASPPPPGSAADGATQLESVFDDVIGGVGDDADEVEVKNGHAPAAAKRRRGRPSKSAVQQQQQQNGATEQDSDSGESGGTEKSNGDPTPVAAPDGRFEFQRLLHAPSSVKRAPVCSKCELGGEVIPCDSCCLQFHAVCLADGAAAADAADGEAGAKKCADCAAGRQLCFLCKQDAGDKRMLRCHINGCGKQYHDACAGSMPFAKVESRGLVCPQHACLACCVDAPSSAPGSSGRATGAAKLVRCVRCPAAYHGGDFCVPAGSEELSETCIVCPEHLRDKAAKTINVAWCFICSQGGSLVCCERCPASFHPECLKLSELPEQFTCDDCRMGRQPRYGDIVWVKVGHFRWWPCEILYPDHAPLNIQRMAHQKGTFPVHFFGTDEYYWVHKGRVFEFEDGDLGDLRKTQGSSRLVQLFKEGVRLAQEACRLFREMRENRDKMEQSKKPPPYKFIRTNYPFGNARVYKAADLSELHRCDCSADSQEPCGSDSDCMNRVLYYECHPGLCAAKDRCLNQRFVKREYPTQAVFKTNQGGRGWGLKAMQDIAKGEFVNEYVGDLIDEEEAKKRLSWAHDHGVTNFYMLTLDKGRIIDAGPKGNLSRFMNHSCSPNLVTQKWSVNGDLRIGLFALRDIKAGEELTFNYNFECLGAEKLACQCGAENCSGFLGVRPRSSANLLRDAAASSGGGGGGGGDGAESGKKRRRTKGVASGTTGAVCKVVYEDTCYRCCDGGEMIMCDKEACPKVYHLGCLGLSKAPSGKWYCPWHHCDECGRPATVLCSECPGSYCAEHADSRIFQMPAGTAAGGGVINVCCEHDDLLVAYQASEGKENGD
ncbi:hypothetical protein BOX15_Mlig026212g1, partial [Macrostomum lignano]